MYERRPQKTRAKKEMEKEQPGWDWVRDTETEKEPHFKIEGWASKGTKRYLLDVSMGSR